MAYYWVTESQHYSHSLGFGQSRRPIDNLPQAVRINQFGQDNSFATDHPKNELRFGTGGVDDAEDAEIILHEYGHAIQDNQVPGFGQSSEGGAMGEGFGDFLAASFFSDVKPKNMKPTVGNWDATAYSGAEPPYLRRLDSNKMYWKELKREVHDHSALVGA